MTGQPLNRQGVRNLDGSVNGRTRHTHQWVPVRVYGVNRTYGFGEIVEVFEMHCIGCPAVRSTDS